MANRVVIGSQWGDEGKAKVVDFLTLDADYIVRFQGGANAGHTVEVGDKKFVFHLIPSGIMHEDKICVIGNGVVLDPIQTLDEIADLHTKGINPEGRLFIADNAHVVLPYHSTLDKAKEKKAGKAAIGTTGRGIGPCYSDKVNRIGVRVGDLMDERELRPRVEAMAKVHNEEFKVMYDVPEIDPEKVIKDYLELGQKIKPFVRDVSAMLYAAVKAGKRLVFEGAQGTILDVDQGTYPFVTSSNTVAGYASCGAGIGPTALAPRLSTRWSVSSRLTRPAWVTVRSRPNFWTKRATRSVRLVTNMVQPRAVTAAAVGSMPRWSARLPW